MSAQPNPVNQDEQGIEVDVEEVEEFPPQTSELLSWSALHFIRAPSSVFLMMSVVIVGLAAVMALLISTLVKMDVTVKGTGEFVSDFGVRDAVSLEHGQVSEILKNVGDSVRENEVIATLHLTGPAQREITNAVSALRNASVALQAAGTSTYFQFTVPRLPSAQIVSGPVFDAMVALEQQQKNYLDLRWRFQQGLKTELKPVRARLAVLEVKLRQMRKSGQKKFLTLYIESTEDEIGKIRTQLRNSENEARLRMEQGFSDFLKAIRNAQGSLENYLSQKQVRAPIDGVIAKVIARENSLIEANKPVAVIMPKDGKLIATIQIPSKDIAKITSGQRVLYKVEAYPYQTFGAFEGQVITFEQVSSADASRAAGHGYVAYGTVGLPVHLSEELRKKMRLMVGMKFDADVVIERKALSEITRDAVFSVR